MSFNDLIAKANSSSVSRFANCTVAVKLSGVTVDSFPGIFDQEQQTVSPFDGERSIGKPSVTALSGYCAGITHQHVLGIAGYAGTSAPTGDYSLDGKPQSDGAGMTTIFLAVKK